jgi:hypothetical protein
MEAKHETHWKTDQADRFDRYTPTMPAPLTSTDSSAASIKVYPDSGAPSARSSPSRVAGMVVATLAAALMALLS